MSADLLAALALFAFVASITPGPNNMMLLASGVNYGFRRTIPHMLGIGFGFTFMLLMIGLGIGQLFQQWPSAYTILKFASAGYMLWLAWQIATAGPVTAAAANPNARTMTFIEAAAFQWVMCGRRPHCKKNLAFGLRSGASHVSGLFARHHDRWP